MAGGGPRPINGNRFGFVVSTPSSQNKIPAPMPEHPDPDPGRGAATAPGGGTTCGTMTRHPLFALWSAALLLGVAAVGARMLADRDLPPKPPEKTTVRLLLADPGYYAGRDVSFDCRALETDGSRLVYRPKVPGPVVFVCTFAAGTVPDPRPARVAGRCDGETGGVVTVSGCR